MNINCRNINCRNSDSRESSETIEISLSGSRSVPSNEDSLREVFDSVLDRAAVRRVVLVMEDLASLGSETVGIIANAHRRLAKGGRELLIRRPSPEVRRVLDITRLSVYIKIDQKIDQAPERAAEDGDAGGGPAGPPS